MHRRILFVSHSSAVSGAEVVLIEIARQYNQSSAFVFEQGLLRDKLSALGLNVLTSRWACGISRFRRDGSIWRAIPLIARFSAITSEIAKTARDHSVIYANSQKAFVLSAIASRVVRRPLIWHLHDIPNREHFGKGQLKLQIGLANACAACVIVPSTAVKDGFVAAGGNPGLVRMVPNGVPVPDNDGRSKQELRADLGLPSGKLIGVFSRLASWKGQHVVIEALADLPDIECIFAGTSLFGEDDYATHLHSLVDQLGLRRRVRFLGHRSDVLDLMRAVDVVVHPSTSPEPFGLTLVEAAFVGTPVVATATGAAPEILEGGEAGWLVPSSDSYALAQALTEVFSSPNEVAMRVSHARGRAECLFSARQMTDAVATIIDDVSGDNVCGVAQ